MKKSTTAMLLSAAIIAVLVWGVVIWQELGRPSLSQILGRGGRGVRAVPTRLATTPLADAEEPGDFTITLVGRVLDALTGNEIPVTAVRIRTPDTVLDFGGPGFQAQIPANRVSTLTILAPGYIALEQQIKPHYQRDATLTMDIPLQPVDLELGGKLPPATPALFPLPSPEGEAWGLSTPCDPHAGPSRRRRFRVPLLRSACLGRQTRKAVHPQQPAGVRSPHWSAIGDKLCWPLRPGPDTETLRTVSSRGGTMPRRSTSPAHLTAAGSAVACVLTRARSQRGALGPPPHRAPPIPRAPPHPAPPHRRRASVRAHPASPPVSDPARPCLLSASTYVFPLWKP
jgi:hypothetical protein